MGSYRIEESPNKRAGCCTTACKKKGVKIQKGEIRLGVWVDTEKYQSWSWRHWGCVTPKVLQNIADAIEEDFELLDGFEDLPAEAQAKVKKAVENGEVDEADKTVLPDESAAEDEPNGADKPAEKPAKEPAEKTKAGTKTKTKKRSRADNEEAEEPVSKNDKKTNGKAAVEEQEETQVEQPSKRRKTRKVTEEAVKEPEKPARKARGRKKKTHTIDDEDDVASHEEEVEAKPSTKKARGKQTAATSEKPKRGRPKRKAADDE